MCDFSVCAIVLEISTKTCADLWVSPRLTLSSACVAVDILKTMGHREMPRTAFERYDPAGYLDVCNFSVGTIVGDIDQNVRRPVGQSAVKIWGARSKRGLLKSLKEREKAIQKQKYCFLKRRCTL